MKTNGSAARRLPSWIDSFVGHTTGLETPEIFRLWSAITVIAATLEQKVWINASGPLHPNLYTMLIAHPGVGKTRTIREARKYLAEIPNFHFAPTSLTAPSLIDHLADAKRIVPCHPPPAMEYACTTIIADEFGTFMHEYAPQMVAVLSSFYDPDEYTEQRRMTGAKVTKILKPQVNMLCGSTPSNLVKFLPEFAWDQGFTSRCMLVFSDKRDVTDIFASKQSELAADLVEDLLVINAVTGEMKPTQEFRTAMYTWRKNKMPPAPTHPKLLHYGTRRVAHICKLSMIAAIDHGRMEITIDDYKRALGWLLDAEEFMPDIFKAGAAGADSKAMDEIEHYVRVTKQVPHRNLVDFASRFISLQSVQKVIDVMEEAGRIKKISSDKNGKPIWSYLGPL
jgi:hypothetical protein